MEYTVTFARQFARLVWLLEHEAANVDEQVATLKAVVTAAKDGPVTLTVEGSQLAANGVALTESPKEAQEFARRLIVHELREINTVASADAAELLNAARALAESKKFRPDGTTAAEQLTATGAQTVWFLTGMPTPAPPASKPASGEPEAPAKKKAPWRSALEGVKRGAGAMFLHFPAQAPAPSAASPQELLARLDSAGPGNAAVRVLGEVATFTEKAMHDGKPHVAVVAFAGIVRREAAIQDQALREPYVGTIRRLCKPRVLQAVAALLAREREWTDDCVAILVRAGVEGADALIEQLTNAQTPEHRRLLFDILLKLGAGVQSLLLMLGDTRWYVVRNAAELLGEMKAVEAERPLISLLRHGDVRVRRAAASALLQLGTATAARAVHQVAIDVKSTPAMRQEAVAALGETRGEHTSAITLVNALEREAEEQVQLAILAALGKVATPEAVNRLVKAAKAERRWFARKKTAYRIAAVRALGEARTPESLAALRLLLKDRDRDVREAATAALESPAS
jgi:HEAT repeat protein